MLYKLQSIWYIWCVMPRKTKRSKVIADYRKRLKMLESQTSFSQPVFEIEPVVKIAPIQAKSPQVVPSPATERRLIVSTHLIMKDLRKTMVLATFAIASEFVLYWVFKF